MQPSRFKFYRLSCQFEPAVQGWINFPHKGAWLDVDAPDVDFIFGLANCEQPFDEIKVVLPDGDGIACQVKRDPELPDRLKQAQQNAPARFYRIRFTYPCLERVTILGESASGASRLLSIVPSIRFPEFIFEILQTTPAQLAPEGFTCFVETGTLYGHTTLHASYWFERVYSIELNDDLFAQAMQALSHRNNTTVLHGDSGDVLRDLAGQLPGPTVFLLDAHWSGDPSVNWQTSRFKGYPSETAHRGSAGVPSSHEQVPLLDELDHILEKCQHRTLVIVDDWESIGRKDYAFEGEDWGHIQKTELIEKFAHHRRCVFHYPYGNKRYLIGLEAIGDSGQKTK